MNLKESEDLIERCEIDLKEYYAKCDKTAFFNQKKVLNAFREHKVALHHFSGTSGYGYDDIGRDTLNRVYASVFQTEQAIVSPHILSGTHALTVALFGVLRPHDVLLSVTGNPYDTMSEVINGDGNGSLKDFLIKYRQIDLSDDGIIQFKKVEEYLKKHPVKMLYIQRSRGYHFQLALSVSDIQKVCKIAHSVNPEICVFVDNCYGEFVEEKEPTQVGADLIAGSLIKNIGGGIAPNGGYIAGKAKFIKLVEGRLTAPSVGGEIGSYSAGYQYFYQGLFLAPHTVAQAIKGAMLFSSVFSALGYETLPSFQQPFYDIICSIKFQTEEELTKFCQTIQSVSPIDSHVVPYAWDMPGYESKVIMAAGCFVQGASIELSADSPIKKPYVAYFQGGLTYEHVKIAVLECIQAISKK